MTKKIKTHPRPSKCKAPRVRANLKAGIIIDITGAGVKEKPTMKLGGQDFW